jgi:hypothetical protein
MSNVGGDEELDEAHSLIAPTWKKKTNALCHVVKVNICSFLVH